MSVSEVADIDIGAADERLSRRGNGMLCVSSSKGRCAFCVETTLCVYAESRSRLETVLSIWGVKKTEWNILFRELALHWEIATVLVVGVIQIETLELFMSAVCG